MTDLDSVNPFEAPKYPSIASEPTIIDPIQYEATPTIEDLNSTLQPVSGMILPGIWLLLLLIVFLGGLSIVLVNGLRVNSSEILALLVLFFFITLIAWHLRSKLSATKTHLRLNPSAISPLKGELTSKGLRLESETRVSWQPHHGLRFCRIKNNQLSLCHDPQGEAIKVLPARGFRNPNQAIRFLELQADKVSTPPNLTEPLDGPSMVGAPSAGAIAFGGVVKGSDLKTSPLESLYRRRFYRVLFVLVLLNAVIIPGAFYSLNWLAAAIIGTVVFVYDLLAVVNLRRSFATYNAPEVPLIAIQGWLDERQIALLHNIGQSLAGWKDFKAIGVTEVCIWLEPYGGKNRFVILPRRFFANDTQWQTAIQIATAHLTK